MYDNFIQVVLNYTSLIIRFSDGLIDSFVNYVIITWTAYAISQWLAILVDMLEEAGKAVCEGADRPHMRTSSLKSNQAWRCR